MFNAVLPPCPFPRQAQEAYITLIPKKGKDTALCSSYQTIFLINVDQILYAKIIALRLQHVIPLLVHVNKVRFVPCREARANVMQVVTLMEWATKRRIPLCLLSVDAKKAFDRLNCSFISATLEHIDMPLSLREKIMALYDCPLARIRVNEVLLDSLIKNGTQQGCPFSPLL